jgi:hypothetical protein
MENIENYNKEIINYIIPMGSQCFSAFFLKMNDLKLTSYPFDWIFSNPSIIKDMLDDNFEKFLDKNNYLHDDRFEKNKHKIYLPDMYLFNHRNPSKEVDHNYYVKCVNRLYNVFEKNGRKLFLMTILNNEIKNEIKNIFSLKEKLDILTDDFLLICFFQKKRGYQNKELYKYDDNLIIINISTIDGENGVIFENEEDNLFYKNIMFELFTFELNEIL